MPQEVSALIERAHRFVLTTHARPDGDAIGSVLSLAFYLRDKGKSVRIINCDPTPFNLEWLPGADAIEVFDGGLEQLEAIASADVVALLDGNALSRVGPMGSSVQGSSAVKLLIDHHTDPESWFDVAYAREDVSSTGQLIFEIITADDPARLTTEIASALYTAILTDTGSFRFSNVTPEVHRAVAEILERGHLDPAELHARIYDRKSLAGLRLLSRMLATMQLSHQDQVAHTVISRRMLEETGANIEETEGYGNWGLAIEGVRVSILFTETERGTKASFRSKAGDHVHRWAQSLGGGGHPNASGAFVRKPLESAIRRVLDGAPKFLNLNEPDGESEDLSDEDRDYLSMLKASPSKTAGRP